MSAPHSQRELQRLYDRRFAGRHEYRNRVWQTLVDAYFTRWLPPQAAVLDLGCGHCEFINHVRSDRRFGMDLNPDSPEYAAPGVRILAQGASERWALEDGSLDVVFTSNFLEHLPTKKHLRETLAEAHRCLRPGGTLIAMGPNIRYVPGAYWDFFDHYIPLTERSLGEVIADVGFTLEERIPRFLPYTMSRGGAVPLWMLRVYLKLPVAWPLLAKQFLLVARR